MIVDSGQCGGVRGGGRRGAIMSPLSLKAAILSGQFFENILRMRTIVKMLEVKPELWRENLDCLLFNATVFFSPSLSSK